MPRSFVDIIGFQFERVHVGMIAWLLDDRGSPLSLSERAKIVSRFVPGYICSSEVRRVRAKLEYSFGRTKHIDLVIEIEKHDRGMAALVIECKTDSDINVDQLMQSMNLYRDKFDRENARVRPAAVALAIGASQFTIAHNQAKLNEYGFHTIDLNRALELFSNLSISGKNNAYDEWVNSLKAEQLRVDQVDRVFQTIEDPWDPKLLDKGYRLRFPVFYMLYGKLRELLEESEFKNWGIYSGGNNPVLNWQNGWIPICNKINLYWEFNWSSFRLKAALPGENKLDEWKMLRPGFVELCENCSIKGKKTANRRGQWVSAYKWEFNFCKELLGEIRDSVVTILAELHPQLRNLTP